jgi:hypothetical protein
MENQQTTGDAQITIPREPGALRRRWRPAAAAVLVGSLAISGLALTHGSQSSASTPVAGSNISTASVSNVSQSSTAPSASAKGRFSGFGDGAGRAGNFRGGLTISGISGSTITATMRGTQTMTITVTSTTKYTRAGATITLGDLHQGDQIAVQGTRAAQGTMTATSIEVVLPRESGVVTVVNGSTLTITGFDSSAHTVILGASTKYTRAGQIAAQSDVTTGTSINVEGTANADGSLNALLVTIQTPRVAGQVSAVSGSSYTIANRAGTSAVTVVATSSTLYVDMSGASVQPSTIVKGTEITAEGTLSSDGKTLTALRITVFSASKSGQMGRGSGSFGQHGGMRGPGHGAPGASPTATPAATTGTGV